MTTAANFLNKLTGSSPSNTCSGEKATVAWIGSSFHRTYAIRERSAVHLSKLLRTFEGAPPDIEVSGVKPKKS